MIVCEGFSLAKEHLSVKASPSACNVLIRHLLFCKVIRKVLLSCQIRLIAPKAIIILIVAEILPDEVQAKRMVKDTLKLSVNFVNITLFMIFIRCDNI